MDWASSRAVGITILFPGSRNKEAGLTVRDLPMMLSTAACLATGIFWRSMIHHLQHRSSGNLRRRQICGGGLLPGDSNCPDGISMQGLTFVIAKAERYENTSTFH